MKKTFKIVLTVALSLVLVLSLCACKGNDGLSAYEIAVKNGFVGTEQQWLKSFNTQTTIEKTTNNVTVDGSVGDLVAPTHIGLKSIVSVYSQFKKISYIGGWFNPQQQETTYSAAGAGVFYQVEADGSAFVITNHHVVYDSDSLTLNKISDNISIFLYGMENSEYAIPATYVGGSLHYDIAVLHVNKNAQLKKAIEDGIVAAAELADSEKVVVGQASIAIGNPEAEGISVTSGIISVESEIITMTAVDNRTTISLRVMRTDTAVNSGNSGGGLFDSHGKLIGIVNAKMNTNTAENIAYAIPSNLVKAVADNIIDHCFQLSCQTVMRPYLGITTAVAKKSTQIDQQTGIITKVETVKITEISQGSLADGVLQVDDVLYSITLNGTEHQIIHSYSVSELLLTARVGDTVKVKVLRSGTQYEEEITITQAAVSAY